MRTPPQYSPIVVSSTGTPSTVGMVDPTPVRRRIAFPPRVLTPAIAPTPESPAVQIAPFSPLVRHSPPAQVLVRGEAHAHLMPQVNFRANGSDRQKRMLLEELHARGHVNNNLLLTHRGHAVRVNWQQLLNRAAGRTSHRGEYVRTMPGWDHFLNILIRDRHVYARMVNPNIRHTYLNA